MIYKLIDFCKKNNLTYETIKKKLQKNELNGIKIGNVWAIDEDTAKKLLKEKHAKRD